MTKIVVLGSDGWLGSNVHRFYGNDSIGLSGSAVRKLLATHSLHNAFLNIPNMTDETTIINAIGSRYGDKFRMLESNVKTPHELSEICSTLHLRFIHFGSAAEYGLNSEKLRISESMDTSPFSEYGKSKLAGSSKVLEYPRSLVLRLFNVVGPGLQPLNPLTDIRLKVESALLNSGTIQLHNSFTVRDFISIDLFLRYLKFSVDKKLTGIYNVCSGVPVSFGDIALEIARRMGCIEAVESELSNQIDFVVGDPTKIRSISGIYEDVDTSAVVDWLLIR